MMIAAEEHFAGVRAAIERAIQENGISNWLKEYPWLLSCIGDPVAPIWFIGENPSLSGVNAVHIRSTDQSANLQWNASAGDRLLREAITEAGLKTGDPASNEGWKCYITNVVKEPEIVVVRNARKTSKRYWQDQADIWMPVLEGQIRTGSAKIFVALGGQAYKILRYMEGRGAVFPPITQVDHYSYVMFRPEAGTRRGPSHPDRIAEFKASIKAIAANRVKSA
jgi:hypothetical protein